MSETPSVSAAPAYGRVSVSGSDITVNGDASARFFGVVDTTALQFAIEAYINGDMSVAGKTSVFNGPDTSTTVNYKMSQNANAEQFWDQYFALLSYYGCNLVRIGAGDTWGTGLQYQAWLNHHDQYMDLLKTMLDAAYEHGVWVVLVLAGSQEYPTYTFGGSGSVFTPNSGAFNNYITYCKDVMSALEDYDSLGWYDLFNEPDHNNCNANFWHNDKTAFNTWASAVAADTKGASTHPRTMGVAGYGTLFNTWGQSDFDLATGKTGFEIAQRHYYASANSANLFTDPEQWAQNDGVPLFWGELAYNAVYPLTRWTFGENTIYANGGQAVTSMVLTGTPGYPYTGGTLPDPVSPPPAQTPSGPTAPALSITSTPGVNASYGAAYSYKVVTSTPAAVTLTTAAPFLSYDASSATVSGTPDAVGTYAVSLTATANGATTEQDYVLTVSKNPGPAPTITAQVLSSPLVPPTEWKLSFQVADVSSIKWDFGDGSTSYQGTEVVHTFQPGQYLVKVTATDGSGRVYNDSLSLTVAPSIGGGSSPTTGYVLGGGLDATLVLVLAGLVVSALGCLHIFGTSRRKKR